MIGLEHYLTVAAILFSIGVAGLFINRKNVIVLLMCLELILLAVNTNFIAFGHYNQNMTGDIFVFFILTVAAAEAAIGLGLLVVLYRKRRTVDVDELCALKG
jgi:NADH-quinone oxidoreductase subunit K